ncbi:MAG: sugar phosphate isomerase/epimerase family protein [Candidatus Bipolaricaulia bacterium]
MNAARRDFKISLAAWSLHRAIRSNLITLLDFPRVARQTFGIEAIELVNTLFAAPTDAYIQQLQQNAEDHGVKILLVMCDGEGSMGGRDKAERTKTVRNHHKWIDIAVELGCHSIRVNLYGEEPQDIDDPHEFIARSVEGFSALVEYGATHDIDTLIENHGGLSSDPEVVRQVIDRVGSPHLGTLPDFGNLPEGVDRYDVVRRMMPYAKAVSAKCHDFDANGNETTIDYERMMKIVVDEVGYHGYIGIEYEGDRLTEYEGILACKALLERLS